MPATVERIDDVLEILPTGQGCHCQYFRMGSSEYAASGEQDRVSALRRQLDEEPPPGVLAYLDGVVAGWCGFGPRPGMERLVRSRTIPKVDDRPYWSIVCFLVRPGVRRRGVTGALLGGVVDLARRSGAPGLEAYPIDPEGRRVDTAFLYVGTRATFARAGFTEVMPTGARSAGLPRLLMRLDL